MPAKAKADNSQFFVEKDEILSLISNVCNESEWKGFWDSKQQWLFQTMEKYLEQPNLLSSSLDCMISPIMATLTDIITAHDEVPHSLLYIHFNVSFYGICLLVCRIKMFSACTRSVKLFI